jgi:hypothetical protein
MRGFLLIPALEFGIEKKLEQNKIAIPHLLRLQKKGTELGSMCTGTFEPGLACLFCGLSIRMKPFTKHKKLLNRIGKKN